MEFIYINSHDFEMPIYLIVALGFISFSTLFVFWWLIVLDIDNQRKSKAIVYSKVKYRNIKKNNMYKIA